MPRPVSTLDQRAVIFWSRVQKTETCWLWIGARHVNGYGRFYVRRDDVYAHRFVYEVEVGPIPPGMDVCHHCDVKACVRPAHLFLGTPSDNMQDAMRKGRLSGLFTTPTHCQRGHELSAGNHRKDVGCLTCRRAYLAQYRKDNRSRMNRTRQAWRQQRRQRGLPHV
jgi:hypothetical protein